MELSKVHVKVLGKYIDEPERALIEKEQFLPASCVALLKQNVSAHGILLLLFTSWAN